MNSYTYPLDELIVRLYDIDGIKFGNYELKSGDFTPVYIDMRVIWSRPDLAKAVCEHMFTLLRRHYSDYEYICGLPCQGTPLASYISMTFNLPMIIKRQVAKTYGNKKLFEGNYRRHSRIALVDDVLMTGGTILDNVPEFIKEGFRVTDAFCFLDRQQGGLERLKHMKNVDVHSVLTISKAFEYLEIAGRATEQTVLGTMQYIRTNRFDSKEHGVVEDVSSTTTDDELAGTIGPADTMPNYFTN